MKNKTQQLCTIMTMNSVENSNAYKQLHELTALITDYSLLSKATKPLPSHSMWIQNKYNDSKVISRVYFFFKVGKVY